MITVTVCRNVDCLIKLIKISWKPHGILISLKSHLQVKVKLAKGIFMNKHKVIYLLLGDCASFWLVFIKQMTAPNQSIFVAVE